MRLAIDLQGCQHGAAQSVHSTSPAATVAQVRAVVDAAQAAGHAVLLVLHHAWPEQAEAVRRMLALPSVAPVAAAAPGQVQLQVLDTPRGADPWRQAASDLLRTAIAPTFEEIGQLAAVAAIRTALNYFLAKEIQEQREELARDRDEGGRREGGALA